MILVSLFQIFLTLAMAAPFVDNPATKVVKAELFDIDHPTKLLYTFDREPFPEHDNLRAVRTYKNPSGDVVAREEIFFEGGKLKKMTIDQKQVAETGAFEVRDGRIYFTYTKGGKTKTDDEKLEEPLLIADTVAAFLQEHWPEIAKGETLKFRFPVPDRLETVGFKFQREGEGTYEGKPVDIVKMSPSSIVISMLVKPLYFSVEKTDVHQVVKVVGRTVPKQQKDGTWKDLDALSIFHHSVKDMAQAPVAAPNAAAKKK